MWEEREIEKIVKKAVKKCWGSIDGESKYSEYVLARRSLVEDILPQIRAIQPDLTDHGPEHIKNVLDNAMQLIGDEKDLMAFGGANLYCLLLSILFHDIGNIFDRRDHQNRIRQVYDIVRTEPQNHNEKLIVLRAAGAHCGIAADGSRDTLGELGETSHLDGRRVDLRKIGAILRFADELAEGPNRTSCIMELLGRYPPQSEIYHRYARTTSITIDKNNQRIALTYNISIPSPFGTPDEPQIRELLEFTFERIVKLNQERQYTKYYCDILTPFQKTSVVFNFWFAGECHDLGLSEINVTDIVIPGDNCRQMYEYNADYTVDSILAHLRSLRVT